MPWTSDFNTIIGTQAMQIREAKTKMALTGVLVDKRHLHAIIFMSRAT